MSCYHPVKAFEGVSGKLVFSDHPKKVICDARGDPVVYYVPCGKCIGCRLDYAREWSIRCVHEAKLHDQNCFITLTYNDDFLPIDGVMKKDVQDFFKRLRARFTYYEGSSPRLRYLACGEYGGQTLRAHYHAIIFGWCPDDLKYFFTDPRSKASVFTSKFLSELWPFGFSTVGEDVSYECCNYVARYVLKKQKMEDENEDFFKENYRPFILASRRPALGLEGFKKYYDEISRSDEVILPGRGRSKPPRYYDKKIKEGDPDAWSRIVKGRKEAMRLRYESEDDMRKQLAIKEVYTKKMTETINKER